MPTQDLLESAGPVPGAGLRFLLVNHLADRLPSRPWGTLVVNLLACFTLGWLLPALERPNAPPRCQPVAHHGFLGQSQHLLHPDVRVVDCQGPRHPGEVGT